MPSGDTLEALPEGFWGSPVTPAPTPEPTPPNPADAAPRVTTPEPRITTPEPIAPSPAATPAVTAADQTASHTDAGSTGAPDGGTIATLQRLFPGRVLRVEAAEPDEPTLGLGAEVEEDAANATATADRESPDSGLESRGSRDT